MTFKAIRPNEITRTMRVDRKKIIRVLGHSNIKSFKKKKKKRQREKTGIEKD